MCSCEGSLVGLWTGRNGGESGSDFVYDISEKQGGYECLRAC
jgi:hypothetical protein